MDWIDLSQRKILITGASSGIGRAVAVLASRLGAYTVLCARSKERLAETQAMLDKPGRSLWIDFDLREFGCYESVFRQAVSDGRKLDGMVHCAGIAKVLPLRIMNHEAVTETMDINFSSFLCLMGMYAKNKYSDKGSVVAVSSANAHYPQKCMSAYAASKAALEAAVKTLAIELAPRQTRINCVIPGSVGTPMVKGMDADVMKHFLDRQLLGLEKPEQIANIILFLLSDAASCITGRSVYADGGLLGQMNR